MRKLVLFAHIARGASNHNIGYIVAPSTSKRDNMLYMVALPNLCLAVVALALLSLMLISNLLNSEATGCPLECSCVFYVCLSISFDVVGFLNLVSAISLGVVINVIQVVLMRFYPDDFAIRSIIALMIVSTFFMMDMSIYGSVKVMACPTDCTKHGSCAVKVKMLRRFRLQLFALSATPVSFWQHFRERCFPRISVSIALIGALLTVRVKSVSSRLSTWKEVRSSGFVLLALDALLLRFCIQCIKIKGALNQGLMYNRVHMLRVPTLTLVIAGMPSTCSDDQNSPHHYTTKPLHRPLYAHFGTLKGYVYDTHSMLHD